MRVKRAEIGPHDVGRIIGREPIGRALAEPEPGRLSTVSDEGLKFQASLACYAVAELTGVVHVVQG